MLYNGLYLENVITIFYVTKKLVSNKLWQSNRRV